MARSKEDCLVFSSLMPHLFPRLPPPPDDTTLTEQELQEINRILALEKEKETKASADKRKRSKCDGSGLRQTTKMPLTVSNKSNVAVEAAFPTKRSLPHAVYCDGKENIPSSGILRRNRFSRRERSSRLTSRRKPFVVDLGKFNIGASETCRIIQDVHAFWEAADERDASEAIVNKLKGESGTSSGSSRTRAVRHENSHRTTSRLRGFSVELPSFAEQMSSDVRPEDEPDSTVDSCFTLLSNPQIIGEQTHMSQIVNCLQSDSAVENPCTYTEASHDSDILPDAISPRTKLRDETQNDMEHGGSGNEIADFLNSSPGSPDKVADDETRDKDNSEITPFMRKRARKSTPFTSPTPPQNPLAGLHLRDNNNVASVEDSGKRRLEFLETMDTADLEPEFVVNTSREDATNMDNQPQNQNQNPEGPAPIVVEETLSTETLRTPVSKQKQPKKARPTRKRALDNRRSSLAAAGTKWEVGVRRSTRIRSKPLEWWKGERFLLGRVHQSLVTVIGIKYTSASPCDSKKGPRFKVESYVPEEYAKYVQFAAL